MHPFFLEGRIRGRHVALVTGSGSAPRLRSGSLIPLVVLELFGQARRLQLKQHRARGDRWTSRIRTLPQSELLGNLTPRGWLAV